MNILSKNNNFHYLSNDIITQNHLLTLREKCPNTEFFFGPHFPAFGLNNGRYGVSLRIQSECGKIRTTKNSVFGHFLSSAEDEIDLNDNGTHSYR